MQRFERSLKTKKVHAEDNDDDDDNNDDDGHRVIDSHTHSLSVTKNETEIMDETEII